MAALSVLAQVLLVAACVLRSASKELIANRSALPTASPEALRLLLNAVSQRPIDASFGWGASGPKRREWTELRPASLLPSTWSQCSSDALDGWRVEPYVSAWMASLGSEGGVVMESAERPACRIAGEREPKQLMTLVSSRGTIEELLPEEGRLHICNPRSDTRAWYEKKVHNLDDMVPHNVTPIVLHNFSASTPGWIYQLIYPPSGTCTKASPCPLTVNLHGAGEHFPLSELVYPFLYPCFATFNPPARQRMGTVMLVPYLLNGTWPFKETGQSWNNEWSENTAIRHFVMPLIERVLTESEGTIDRERVFIIGHSEGGNGCLISAIAFPDVFAMAMCSAPFLGRDYSREALAGRARLAEGGRRRLETIVLSQGATDLTRTTLDRWTNTSKLLEPYNIQLRVYKGLKHASWFGDYFNWLGLFEVAFTGRCHTETVGCSNKLRRWERNDTEQVSMFLLLLGGAWALMLLFYQGARARAALRALCVQRSADRAGAVCDSNGTVAMHPSPKDLESVEVSKEVAVDEVGPQAELPAQTLFSAFKKCATEHPGALAVAISTDSTLTYQDLAQRARATAAWLRERGLGGQPSGGSDSIVGVCAERGIVLSVAYVAVGAAGGAIIPLPADSPVEHLAGLLSEVPVRFVLTTSELSATTRRAALTAGLDGATVLTLDGAGLPESSPHESWRSSNAPDPAVSQEALAMVYMTSGSSGRPKAVLRSHMSIFHVAHFFGKRFGLADGHRVLALATPIWSTFNIQFWMPLVWGACCVMAKVGGEKDPTYLAGQIVHHRIRVLSGIGRLLERILDELEAHGPQPWLQVLRCAGERTAMSTVERFLTSSCLSDTAVLYNGYGTTESGGAVTFWCARRGLDLRALGGRVPVGRPCESCFAYVVRPGTSELVKGSLEEPGEILLGAVHGSVLALGYLNSETEEQGKWLQSPFEAGGRLYRTGDLGYWEDGQLHIAGRLDRQLKVRGKRLAPEQIENCLKERVASAAVVAAPWGDALLAYVAGPDAQADELLQHCRVRLPEHMVPSSINVLSKLPELKNGKTDFRALQELAGAEAGGHLAFAQDSLGRGRLVATTVLAENQARQAAYGVCIIAVLVQHWFPHDGGMALQDSAGWLRFAVWALTSVSAKMKLIALFVGLGDFRQIEERTFRREGIWAAVVLLVIYVSIGLPRYFAPEAGLATFHRWTCLVFALLKLLGLCYAWLWARLGQRRSAAVAIVLAGVMLAVAPWLIGRPLLPTPPPQESGSLMQTCTDMDFSDHQGKTCADYSWNDCQNAKACCACGGGNRDPESHECTDSHFVWYTSHYEKCSHYCPKASPVASCCICGGGEISPQVDPIRDAPNPVAMVFLENFRYVDLAHVAVLSGFYLLGLGAVPQLLLLLGRPLLRPSTFTAHAVTLLAALLFCGLQALWVRLDVAYDNVAEVDWPKYFDSWYWARIAADAALCALLIAFAWGTSLLHSALAAIGQTMFGTYVMHLYFHPDMEAAMWEAGRLGGNAAQLALLILGPAAYSLSVGFLCQQALALTARACTAAPRISEQVRQFFARPKAAPEDDEWLLGDFSSSSESDSDSTTVSRLDSK